MEPLPVAEPAGVWMEPEVEELLFEGVVLVAPLPLTEPEPLVVSLPVDPWLRLSVLQPARSAARAIIKHAFFIVTFRWLFPCPKPLCGIPLRRQTRPFRPILN